MYRTITLAAALAAALGIAGAVAETAGPTDPQIAHIAYTAGLIDIEAGKQALEKSQKPCAPSPSR